MPVAARFDLKMDADEKAVVAKAAALMGTTMACFVRAAAKEKAQALLERETRVTLSARDFSDVTRALDSAFALNPVLKQALARVRRRCGVLEEQALDPTIHDRLAFDCGARALMDFECLRNPVSQFRSPVASPYPEVGGPNLPVRLDRLFGQRATFDATSKTGPANLPTDRTNSSATAELPASLPTDDLLKIAVVCGGGNFGGNSPKNCLCS